MGCITAIPADIRVHNVVTQMVEINFLCVHKKLRAHRLAPVLIKEVTRRVNALGRWQAVYTAGVVLPKPVGKCRYYHRSLNPKKLIEVRFSSLPAKMTLASLIKKLKLANKTANNFIPMEREDIPTVLALLTENLSRYIFRIIITVQLIHFMHKTS
jgi:glycylpeptide N-tetradecanoyltransferase